MTTCQRKPDRGVIELCIQPIVDRVAHFAGGRVSSCDVIWCHRLLKVRFMARVAHRGHALESAVGRILVAGIAIDRRMAADQREAVVVLLHFLD